MTVSFLNGKFYGEADGQPLAQAAVSAFDAGLQHGVGLFETMTGGVVIRAIEGERSHGEEVEGWVLHLDEHLERLAASAKALGLSQQIRVEALGEAVMETVKRSRLERARVRLTITGGDLSMLAAAQKGVANAGGGAGSREADPTVLIVAQPATEYPAGMFERGVSVVLADARANPLDPFQGHKTLNYWWRLRELQAAAAKQAAEALVLSVTNHVCSGCVSNVILIKDEAAITPIARGEEAGTPEPDQQAGQKRGVGKPGLPSPVLPGVTRAWAIDRLERWGVSTRPKMVSVQEVIDADEVLLTNSSWGVLPVVRVEANQIGAGTPGRFGRDLREAWLELLPREPAE